MFGRILSFIFALGHCDFQLLLIYNLSVCGKDEIGFFRTFFSPG